jgi:hypothetical protein
VTILRAMGFNATHDTYVRGHCDIVLEGKNGFLWLAEAKIHRDYAWLLKGLDQLSTRYSTGGPGQDAGTLIIYCKRPRIDKLMVDWQQYLQTHYPKIKMLPCRENPNVFVSAHVHIGTGAKFRIRHVPVSLYFDPKDRPQKVNQSRLKKKARSSSRGVAA